MIIRMEDFISKHPLFERWKTLRARKVLCPEWHSDARAFIRGVGDRPEGCKKLTRPDTSKPYGPGNAVWGKTPTREDTLAYYRQWNRSNPNARRQKHFAEKYGITIAQFDEMMEAQGGRCAICGSADNHPDNQRRGLKRKLSVDHNHETGEVRGLLCGDCNIGLGHFKDDPARLFTAIQYLTKWGKTKVS